MRARWSSLLLCVWLSSSSAFAFNSKDVARAKRGDKNLAGADLSGAKLRGVDLSGADLSGAKLQKAKLQKAKLSGANLTGADLSGAKLRGADLSGAVLWGASLKDASLRGVSLLGAELSGADLSEAALRLERADLLDSRQELTAKLGEGKQREEALTAANQSLTSQLEETKKQLSQKETELSDLLGQLKDTTVERDKTSTALEGVQGKVSDLEARLKKTSDELARLREQQAQIEKRLAVFKDLTARLQSMIDSGTLKVSIRNGQMLVELPAEVLFDSGKAELSESGEETMMRVASSLQELSDRRFLVAGHTDDQPLRKSAKFADNWELSTARALTVTKALIAGGMSPKNLSAAGYSEYEPVASNSTEAGRRQNRRIELVLLPNLSELPKLSEK